MTLRDYLRVLRERWRVVALLLILTTGVAVLITGLTPKVYQAHVQLFVAPAKAPTPDSAYQVIASIQSQVSTYAQIVANQEVIKGVKQDLQLAMSDQEVKDEISATTPQSTSLINLYVNDRSPLRAEKIANSAARHFRVSIATYTKNTGSSPAVKLNITDPAVEPSDPIRPQPVLNISLGIILGLLLGVAFAVARELLDNRIKDAAKLSKVAGAPVMGVVVDDPTTERQPVAARVGPHNSRAENFRQMRVNLQFANLDEQPRIIAVTSATPGEGKSTVAINLASTLAEAGFTVCLVDADLRRPTIAKTLGLVAPAGLTTVLIQQIGLDEALQSAGSTLCVLTSGPTPPNPSEVLASAYVREVVRSLLDRFDYVILDTAPLLPVADGAEVAALADGTLLIARHGETTETQVSRAVEHLRQVEAKVIGVVLNRVPTTRRGGDYYSYSYYRTEPAAEPAPNANGRRRDRETV